MPSKQAKNPHICTPVVLLASQKLNALMRDLTVNILGLFALDYRKHLLHFAIRFMSSYNNVLLWNWMDHNGSSA